ncbi:hypothetical protein ACH4NT_13715 [Streptomyces lydicus]|uniref:hypothetical protein n=1 Tax=Streptomyces lydicus TaxID=47763 RepID=UPI0037B9A803
MPTAIAVTSPDLALPSPGLSTSFEQGGAPLDRQTPAAVVLPAPHLQPLDDALTETSAVLEHHGHLVVLYSSACRPDHIRRLHTLRAVLESDRIAILPVPLPPLGVALLARQLRQLSQYDLSPGVLASAARLLTHYIHAGALLGSVSGLDRIEVDLRSHVKSWLPGAHFAVLANPEPQLLHVDRHSTGAGLPAPGFATHLAVARGQLNAEWVTGALAPAWRVQAAYEARLPAESARWWGTQKLIEFAAAIPDPAVLHQLVASVRRERCGWCGLELLGDRCAFCAAPLARDRAPRGGSSERGPVAIAGTGRRAEHGPERGTAQALERGTAHGEPPAATSAPAAAPPGPAPAPRTGPTGEPEAGPPPPAPWAERGLAPVAPPGVPGATGATGGTAATGAAGVTSGVDVTGATSGAGAAGSAGVPGGYGSGPAGGRSADRGPGGSGPGHLDVRGPDLTLGGPLPSAPGNPYGPGHPAQGNAYGPGHPVSGNPYGSGHPVPGNPYAADGPRLTGHRDLPGHPDFALEPDAAGRPRTVARVR